MSHPANILSESARRFADRKALFSGGRTFTYRELDTLVDAMARSLQARGVGPGSTVSIYSENRWEWVVSYHAIMRVGAVANPLNVMLTPPEVAHATADCGASMLIGSGARVSSIDRRKSTTLGTLVSFDETPNADLLFGELACERDQHALDPVEHAPEALASVSYTSGTTGFPKGALQSGNSIYLNCALTATMHGRQPSDIVVTALPAPHVYGNVVINSTLMTGGLVCLMERFDPAGAVQAMTTHAATMFEGVPAMYATMLASEDVGRITSLTRCTVGGQTIPTSTIEEWERRTGAPLLELWGMTELSGLGTTHAIHAPRVPGSIGVTLPGIEARIADPSDPSVTMPKGSVGELVVRGPLVMMGYFGNPAATAEVITEDGWLRTGDIAYASDSGHFFVVDRLKDVILTGGYNVYPAEIERVVATHPAVAQVAVGRVPDPVKGELARAYVVLHAGAEATEEAVIEHCRGQLAAYKLPRSVRFVTTLPTTSSGKVVRRRLGELDTGAESQ